MNAAGLVAVVAVARAGREVADEPDGRMRRLPTVLGALGGVVLLAGAGAVFGVLPFSVQGPFEPLVVAAGATALGVAVWLAGVARADGPSAAPAVVAVLGAVVLVAAYGAWPLYAQDVGTATGRGLAGSLASRPAVTVYSKERLALFGPELTATPLPGRPYVVEYGGLRLLIRTSDGTMYLLPRQWRHGIDAVYVLPPGARIRLEIVATPDAG